MRRFEERWAVAALSGFAPEGATDDAGLTPRSGEVNYQEALRTMVQGSNLLGRIGIRLAIWMVTFSPLWAMRRFSTLVGLEAYQRSELLHRLLEHPAYAVRELTLLLKVITCMALLRPGPVRARTAYDLPTETVLPGTAAANTDHQEVA